MNDTNQHLTVTINRAKQLLVEGKDQEVFFDAFLDHLDIADVEIRNYGGGDELGGFLKAFRDISGFDQDVESLGIIRDAEANPLGAFQSTCDLLRNADLPVPSRVLESTSTTPKVSVLILPDASTPGMLESLCLRAVNQDPVIECIEQYFDCVDAKVDNPPRNEPKARLQVFLASRPSPALEVGYAAHRGYLNLESTEYQHVRQFLHEL